METVEKQTARNGKSERLVAGQSPAGNERIRPGYLVFKRVFDVAFSLGALIVLFPLMLVTAVIVSLQDLGPPLYRQKRVGKNGELFEFYKFRSMILGAEHLLPHLAHLSDTEGAAFKMRNDPRVTLFGKFIRRYSIDELPQFICVFLGHMSVIGPRPHLPSEVEAYSQEHRLRLAVKPGLICLREVSGRSHLTFEQWIMLDLEYVRNRSLLFDLKIFLKAIPAVLSGEGAY